MKEFLIDNYSWIISLVIGVASLLIFLLKKVKIIEKDTDFEKVLAVLPSLIVKAEKSGKSGPQKKEFVIASAIYYLLSLKGEKGGEVDINAYSEKIGDAIEAILSTPVKKEVKDENKK